MLNNTDKIASKYLGQKVSGCDVYKPDLLVFVPRFENRMQYSIDETNLPFLGFDVWHSYEFSCMTQNGLPVTRVLKLRYACESDCIVESKSLKLYLNSFNMTKYGTNTEDCLRICKSLIEKDLSENLKVPVKACFIDEDTKRSSIFTDYTDITKIVNENNLVVDKFKEAPELLEIIASDTVNSYKLFFNSLRSNCRVTHQPDFGDVFIYYKSKKHIKEDSLIKYLCSFRSEYHFHEECCEMIFKRLYDLLDENDELLVTALYTRRGGIDICPTRWTRNINPDDVFELISVNKFARKSIKQ